MKILKNKYFILGNLALLLAAIPLTLLFVSRQQDIRSQAAPSTRITFSPQNISFDANECSEQVTTVRMDPGENIVGTVELFLTYDSTKFDIEIEPNGDAFPEILSQPNPSNGEANVIMNIGADPTNAIQSPTDIADITIIPVDATEENVADLQIDSSQTRVFSINSESDEASENVFLGGGQATVSISSDCVDAQTSPSPSPSPSESPSPSPVGGDDEPTATPTPTPSTGTSPSPSESPSPSPSASVSPGTNQAPVCSTLSSSPSASGSAPFVLTLTSQGTDPDGTIQKATFDFGDGTIQDVNQGLGAQSVSTQLSHTYQTAGNYSASVIFTDNSGAVSSSCVKQITVNEGTQATSTPAPTSGGGIQPTATFTPTPTIADPGGIGTTVAILGGLLLIIIGGAVLIII